MVGGAVQTPQDARIRAGIAGRPATIFWNSSRPMPPEQE
jgi:hypothetical protein